jgi:hypothetical protein
MSTIPNFLDNWLMAGGEAVRAIVQMEGLNKF